MTILYNCHHDGDQYRVTKFSDAEVVSSYLCTTVECECPAGHRETCRHRQMLPTFINMNLVNTHWFLAWDTTKQIVDLLGHPYVKSEAERQTFIIPEGFEAIRDAEGRATGEVRPAPEGLPAEAAPDTPANFIYSEDDCPGHVASEQDPKVCGKCGVHIDSLRPAEDEVLPAEALCKDEGCPQANIEHICIENPLAVAKPWRRI